MVKPEAFKTKNIICAFEATVLFGFNSCKSFIAFSPKGVAALSRPSILAEKFIIIEPTAGWSFGISGNKRVNKGATNFDMIFIAPPSSPIFIKPIHKHKAPVIKMDNSKPFLEASNKASIIF